MGLIKSEVGFVIPCWGQMVAVVATQANLRWLLKGDKEIRLRAGYRADGGVRTGELFPAVSAIHVLVTGKT